MKNGIRKFFFYIIIFNSIFLNNLLAEPVNGDLVSLQILDKVTSQLENIQIKVGENIIYGSLKIEIFSCMKRPPEEIPEDFVLLSIKDENSLKKYIQIFQGWMISSSPSVTPFEHPTYDIWVKDCKILSENL